MTDAPSAANALAVDRRDVAGLLQGDLTLDDLVPREHSGQYDSLTEARAHMDNLEAILSEAHGSIVSTTLRDRIFDLRQGTEDILGQGSDVISMVQNEVVHLTEEARKKKTQAVLLAASPFLTNPSSISRVRKSFASQMRATAEAADKECAIRTREVEVQVLRTWEEVLRELYDTAQRYKDLGYADEQDPAERLAKARTSAVDAFDDVLKKGLERIRKHEITLVKEVCSGLGNTAIGDKDISPAEFERALLALQGRQEVLALEGRLHTSLPSPAGDGVKLADTIEGADGEIPHPHDRGSDAGAEDMAEAFVQAGGQSTIHAQRMPAEQTAFRNYFGDRFGDLLGMAPEGGGIVFSDATSEFHCEIYREKRGGSFAARLRLPRMADEKPPELDLAGQRKPVTYALKNSLLDNIKTMGGGKKEPPLSKEKIIDDILSRVGEAVGNPLPTAVRPRSSAMEAVHSVPAEGQAPAPA